MKKFALSTVVAAGLVFAPNTADAFSVEADSMSEGDVNDSVNALQLELKDQGYFQGSTGSTFGPRTLSAVKEYQEDHGISSPAGNFFGVAGPQTQASLEGDASDETAETSGNSGSMERGAVSESVSDLQTQLQDLGYYDGQVDSIFGPQTENAVKAFQADHGVSSSAGNFFGVAGPATMSALENNPSENVNESAEDSGDNNNSEESSGDNESGGDDNAEETSEDNTDNNSGGNDNSGSDNNSGGNTDDGNTGEVLGVDDASAMIATAEEQKGVPYSFGAQNPGVAFDCSGFVNYVYGEHGQDIPRDTSGMYNASTEVANPSEGDLVFFDTSGGVSHVGIYIGNNQFIHASASNGVTIDSIDDPYYWGDKYIGAGSL